MTMTILQGSLGSGKSASMVVDLIDFLTKGGVVASNFRLVDDWAIRIAERHLLCRIGLRDPVKRAKSLYERLMIIGSCDSLWKASEILIPRVTGKVSEHYEGHGRLYIDEAQLYFNSREWSKNKDFIHFFSQSRKLKWDVYLVAHDVSMIDKQIRNFLEYEVRFRNLQKVKLPFTSLPVAPFPCFLGITRYAGRAAGSGSIVSRKVYPLEKWASALYDSSEIFSLEPVNEPEFCGPRPGRCGRKVRVSDPDLRAFFEEVRQRWGT